MESQSNFIKAYCQIKSEGTLTDVQKNRKLANLIATSDYLKTLAVRYCSTVSNTNLTEDLISETCLKVLTMPTFPVRNGTGIIHYLATSFRNNLLRKISVEAAEKRNRRNYFDRSDKSAIGGAHGQASTCNGVEASEIRTGIQAIENESPELGTILKLLLAGASCADVANALELTRNQARYKITVAKKQLRKVLENSGDS